MNKKLIFGTMLVCLLALSLALIGCPTDSDDGGGGGGSGVPADHQGTWKSDSRTIMFDENLVYYHVGILDNVNGNTLTFTFASNQSISAGSAKYELSSDKTQVTFSECNGFVDPDSPSNGTEYVVTNGTYTKQ
jgi:hypothetical protein